MSEPTNRARVVDTIVPGVRHWSVNDDRIDFRSDAYAVTSSAGTVVIDPLPLTAAAAESLGPVRAVCITGGFHQRSAWSFRERTGAVVHAPRGARGLLEQPDAWYDDGDEPVAGIRAWRRFGPSNPHFVLLWGVAGRGSVLFSADLLVRGPNGAFRMASDDHQDDPARCRESVKSLLELDADVLCPAHGAAQVGGVVAVIRAALLEGPG